MAGESIRRVAAIGTGTIGASWTAVFLARGLTVSASDPAPGAESFLREFVATAWPREIGSSRQSRADAREVRPIIVHARTARPDRADAPDDRREASGGSERRLIGSLAPRSSELRTVSGVPAVSGAGLRCLLTSQA